MASCPSCRRPVALTRATCLYCGRPLPPELLEAIAPRASPPPPPEPLPARAGEPRGLLVAQLDGVSPESLARALGRTVLEAGQLVRRRGWSLLGILGEHAAREGSERLAAAGIRCLVLEARAVEAASVPWIPTGGRFEGGRLLLRGERRELSLAPGELCLVVSGAIRREYQAREVRAREVRTATLEQGHRFHLHRHRDPQPVELDPVGLEFDDEDRTGGSSLLRVGRWVDALLGDAARDEGFRFLPPALAPAAPEPERGALAAADRLRRERSNETVILDNLAQFRFYSAWRGYVERSLAG